MGVITTRVGAALALLFSLVALGLAIVAFMATVRDEEIKPGRLVQTRVNSDYAGEPLLFPVDDFFIGYDSRFDFRAFYVYPPGYYGHMRGCRVIWDSNAAVDTDDGQAGPGLYIDPCGGARFGRDGELLAGPADRGLDYFATEPGVEGVIVDTRTLYCGEALPTATPTSDTTETAEPSATATSVDGGVTAGAGTSTPTPTATVTATETATGTAEGEASGTPEREKCERVSPDSKQR
jgi:hypothetical protein